VLIYLRLAAPAAAGALLFITIAKHARRFLITTIQQFRTSRKKW
jgi:hypothetical protein